MKARALILFLALVILCLSADDAAGAGARAATAVAHATTAVAQATTAVARAPTGPPLRGGAAATLAEGSPSGDGDPLVENGLGSPVCQAGSAGAGSLSGQALENCRTSGWVAAGAPTSNYAFDLHANGGPLGVDAQGLFQQYLLAPVWMGLVWIVHALLAMLEWAYSIDLLDGSAPSGSSFAPSGSSFAPSGSSFAPSGSSFAPSGLGRGLRETQAVFTQPWLVVVLAVASVLAAYHGLVRRQVAQTVGQVLLMTTMMVGGLWVIADPTGTVGEVGSLANQASLGALGAFAQGSPAAGARTLSDGMREVFTSGIEDPWCYLEFGDVRWCSDPTRLEQRLRVPALRLAAGEQALVGCKLNSGPFSFCVAPGSSQARAYAHSAELLREARTNGELFLALPANGTVRNSTAAAGGLLTVLCGGSEIGSCRGPTAAQAEFRGADATEQRAAGLLLIVLGTAGMVALLGFLVLHLLAAALKSLFYLLLAPAAVLAPALGDGGRAAFHSWATRLLGAVVAKLMYSILLGATLAMVRLLLALKGIGWWPQWLLVCAAWWGVFHQRHHALGVLEGRRFDRRVVLPIEEN